LVLLPLSLLAPRAFADGSATMRQYETQYYVLYTDLPEIQAKDAALRMTKMAEVYHRRTADFSGAIHRKFPVYMYANLKDYYADGGRPDSGGLFDGRVLRVAAADGVNARVWHVLQHEGFHQFASAVIGGERPMWLNEGIAEYFGEAVFTGDDYVTGIVPQWRLTRVREELADKRFASIDQMMQLTPEQWNGKLSVANYDQGWAMVHFLIHGDGGKYRDAFGRFMQAIGNHHPWRTAWADQFGNDTVGFEQRWSAYWSGLPDHPTLDLYTSATVATLTSYLARAAAAGQTFGSLDELLKAGEEDRLKLPADQWLPPSLWAEATARMKELEKLGDAFTLHLEPGKKTATVIGTTPSGT
jgi:hypothetical protein